MACVNACPDTAILATAQPRASLRERIEAFVEADPGPVVAGASISARFVATQKYATVPERRGLEPADFGIFVDPAHCKGCGECVEVCAHLGHDALVMIDKQPETVGASSLLRPIDATRPSCARFRPRPPSIATTRRWQT
jgi:Pyruvate/2-oxoacid:ferredoxin oxidoreductase delta subunit